MGNVTGSSKPSVPKNMSMFQPPPQTGMSSANASMVPPNMSTPNGPIYAGVLNQPPNPHTNTVTTKSGINTTVVKPTPNKNVVAQQQALNQANKNTPGYVPLVEDGITGDKTRAAIAKYGTGATTSAPVKAPNDPSNKYRTDVPNTLNTNYSGYVAPTGNTAQPNYSAPNANTSPVSSGSYKYNLTSQEYQNALKYYGGSDEAVASAYGYTPVASPVTPPPSTSVPPPIVPVVPPVVPPAQVGSTKENAQTVLDTGPQTPNEQQTYKGFIGQSQNSNPIAQSAGQNLNTIGNTTSPAVIQANQELENLKNEYMQKGLNIQGTAGFLTQANGEQGLLSQQYNNALAAAQGKLQNALTAQSQQIGASTAAGGIGNSIQGLQQGALSNANSAAQTQAGRATGVAGTVLSASMPAQISGSARTYNPLDPTGTSGTNGIITGANNQSTYDLQIQYNQGKVALQAADGIQNQIVSTLQSNSEINTNPVSFLTNLNQYVSGQLGTAPQQLLAQQVNNYIKTLVLDPNSVVSIQSQQRGTLAQLLDSLRQTAQTQNDAKNPANLNLGGTSNNSPSSTTGGSSTGYANGGAF